MWVQGIWDENQVKFKLITLNSPSSQLCLNRGHSEVQSYSDL